MPFVSITRLRVRKLRFLPKFGYYTLLAYVQAWQAKGNIRTMLLRDVKFTFWTLSVWETAEATRAYRNGGAHAKAMPFLAEWCDEATYVHWIQESDTVPALKLVFDRLVQDGIGSRVKSPSPDHAAKNFARPKWANLSDK